MFPPEGFKPGSIDGTEMLVLEAQVPGAKCIGTIAMCTRDQVSAQTAISWMMDDRQSYLKPGEFALRYIVQGNILIHQRNQCVRDMDGDWILFIDSDMVWQPRAIKDIIETRAKYDFDILGALCHQRSAPYQPTVYVKDPKGHGYTFLEKWPQGAALKVDATGMAFCIIHKRVFDRMSEAAVGEPMPPLEERRLKPPPPIFEWPFDYGEDFAFCQRAQATGSEIYVDTTIEIGHVGQQIITRDTFLREIAFRSDEARRFRQSQLADVGQAPMSPSAALAELERRNGEQYPLVERE